jgi:hypothetical protein
VLRQSDLPPGWQGAPHQGSNTSDQTGAQLARCLGVPSLAADNAPTADSDDFSRTDPAAGDETISNSISVGASASTEKKAFTAIEGSRAPGCINQVFSAVIKQQVSGSSPGVTVGNPTTTNLDVGRYLDRTVAFRMTVPISASGQSITVTLDLAFAQRGRYTAELFFSGTKAPVDGVLERQAIAAVTGRMTSF